LNRRGGKFFLWVPELEFPGRMRLGGLKWTQHHYEKKKQKSKKGGEQKCEYLSLRGLSLSTSSKTIRSKKKVTWSGEMEGTSNGEI